jgi:hypothetical protein
MTGRLCPEVELPHSRPVFSRGNRHKTRLEWVTRPSGIDNS